MMMMIMIMMMMMMRQKNLKKVTPHFTFMRRAQYAHTHALKQRRLSENIFPSAPVLYWLSRLTGISSLKAKNFIHIKKTIDSQYETDFKKRAHRGNTFREGIPNTSKLTIKDFLICHQCQSPCCGNKTTRPCPTRM